MLITRKELEKEYNECLNHSLTIAVAPMGYGKTVMARSLSDKLEAHFIWIRFEEGLSELNYLWESILNQLRKQNINLDINYPQTPIMKLRFADSIEKMHFKNDCVLVIDDFHFIDSIKLDELIEYLARKEINNFHILLLSRTMPNIKIEELKYKGLCYVIKASSFLLSDSEVNNYLINNNIYKDETINKKIGQLSKGWISALYLICEDFKNTNMVSASSVKRLLEQSLLSKHNVKELEIISILSLLNNFSLKDCECIFDSKIPAFIRCFLKTNQFILYDTADYKYTMHSILKGYLNEYFNKYNKEKILTYSKIGKLLIDKGDYRNGMDFLIKAGEYDLLAQQFNKDYTARLFDIYTKFMFDTYNIIPKEIIHKYPYAVLNYVSFCIMSYPLIDVKQLLLQEEEYYVNNDKLATVKKQKIKGEFYFLKALLELNDCEKVEYLFEKAKELIGGLSVTGSKEKIGTMTVINLLFFFYTRNGKLKHQVDIVSEQYKNYIDICGGCGAGCEYLVLSEYYLEICDFEMSEIMAKKAIRKAAEQEQSDVALCGYFEIARSFMLEGDYKKPLEKIMEIYYSNEVQQHMMRLQQSQLCLSYIGSIIGDKKLIAQWIIDGDFSNLVILHFGTAQVYLIHIKALLLEKDYRKIDDQLDLFLEDIKMNNYQLGYIHYYVLKSIVSYNTFGIEKALVEFEKASEIASKDNVVTSVAEYGNNILPILKKYRVKKNTKYVNTLLEKTKQYAESYGAGINLTKKEKHVFMLLENGLTYDKISKELGVSISTINKHTISIYRKLDVKNKTQAIKKAKTLNLL